jgi:hypothetical protein
MRSSSSRSFQRPHSSGGPAFPANPWLQIFSASSRRGHIDSVEGVQRQTCADTRTASLSSASSAETPKFATPGTTPATPSLTRHQTSWKRSRRRMAIQRRMASLHRVGQVRRVAATLTKGMHLRSKANCESRKPQREGANQRVWEIRADSILKLDRAQRQEEPVPAEGKTAGVPL